MIVNESSENYQSGYIKLFRSIIKKGWYTKQDYLHLWVHLLLKANHRGKEFIFSGENIKLKPGQFVTGRLVLQQETGINQNKIERILKFFEIEQQIEQQKSNKNRVITILSWHDYQITEQQVEQQANNKRTTSEQQVNTNKNDKNIKNDNNEKKEMPILFEMQEIFKEIKSDNYLFSYDDLNSIRQIAIWLGGGIENSDVTQLDRNKILDKWKVMCKNIQSNTHWNTYSISQIYKYKSAIYNLKKDEKEFNFKSKGYYEK